jgi:hypothetical protein
VLLYSSYRLGLARGSERSKVHEWAAPASEPIGFTSDSIDLGEAPWHTAAPFELRFYNGTERQLTVASIESSCGCTVLEVPASEQPVIPGKSALLIPGVLHTRGETGSKEYKVRVVTREAGEYTCSLVIDVFGTYKVEPREIDFGKVRRGALPNTGSVREFVFESSIDEVVSDPTADVDWIRCRRAATCEASVRYEVMIDPTRLRFGLQTGTLCLETSNPDCASACVRVRVLVIRELTAVPEEIYLSPGEDHRVEIRDANGRLVEARRVEGYTQGIAVQIVDGGLVEVVADTAARPIAWQRLLVSDSLGRQAVVAVSLTEKED